MASTAPAAAEFKAVQDEMRRLSEPGAIERVGVAVAQRLADDLVRALQKRADDLLAESSAQQAAGMAAPTHGKDKPWAELGESEVEAAKALGWRERPWERGSTKPMDDRWDALPDVKRAHAELLGFNQAIWDGKGVAPAGGASATGRDEQYRCGELQFAETGRTVPYLVVPRGAARSPAGVATLLKHMREHFSLADFDGKLFLGVRCVPAASHSPAR